MSAMRQIATALTVAILVLLAYRLGYKRGENARPGSPAPVIGERHAPEIEREEEVEEVADRLFIERQRLRELREMLNEVRRAPAQPPTGSADAHIENLSQRIAALNGQLAASRSEGESVNENAQSFRQDQIRQMTLRQSRVQSQITELSAQIAELRAQPELSPASRRDLRTLEARRDLLGSQLAELRLSEKRLLSEIDQQQLFDRSQVRGERADLLRQLNDLKASLEYWRIQRTAADGAPSLRTQRILELEREVGGQERVVEELRSRMVR